MRNILPRSPSTFLQQNWAPHHPCTYRGEAGMEHASAWGDGPPQCMKPCAGGKEAPAPRLCPAPAAVLGLGPGAGLCGTIPSPSQQRGWCKHGVGYCCTVTHATEKHLLCSSGRVNAAYWEAASS